jgi:hypothetical protein
MSLPGPRFQFSLRTLFWWVLALCVLFALAKAPWPANGYFAPLYASVLAGYAGSRSPWLAAALGALSSLTTSWLIMTVEVNRQAIASPELWHFPWIAGCCCLPGGAYVGLAAGMIASEYRNKRRFKSKLESLFEEVAKPPAEEPPNQT